jgi:hypothetical protein
VVALGPERVGEFDLSGLPLVQYDPAVAQTARTAPPPPAAADGPGHW